MIFLFPLALVLMLLSIICMGIAIIYALGVGCRERRGDYDAADRFVGHGLTYGVSSLILALASALLITLCTHFS